MNDIRKNELENDIMNAVDELNRILDNFGSDKDLVTEAPSEDMVESNS